MKGEREGGRLLLLAAVPEKVELQADKWDGAETGMRGNKEPRVSLPCCEHCDDMREKQK